MASDKITLNELLYGDQGAYGHLFPFRDKVPRISKHIFTDLLQSKMPLDETVLSKMLDLDYIGWTAKVILGLDLFPIQIAMLQTMWNTPFPMLIACRGGSKSFMLAVYAVLRALLDPGAKIVIVGAGLRQARLVFNYIDTMWGNSPVLRSIVGGGQKSGPRQNVDLCYFKVGDSIIYALPTGDGCCDGMTCITCRDGFSRICDDQLSGQTQKTIVNRYRSIWSNGKFRMSDESYCNGNSKTKKILTNHGFEFNATHNHRLRIVRNKQIMWCRMDAMKIGDRIMLDRSVRWHDGDSKVTEEEAYRMGLSVGDGINHSNTKDEQFPSTILQSSRDTTSAFISGLMDMDGTIHTVTDKTRMQVGVIFHHTSKELIHQLQYILLHYGIVATVKQIKRYENQEECYELSITGRDVLTFMVDIGFRIKKKQDELLVEIAKEKTWTDQNDYIPDILDYMIDVADDQIKKYGPIDHDSSCVTTLRNKDIATRPLIHDFLLVYGHISDPRIDVIRRLADPHIYYDEIISIKDSECVTFDVHVPAGHEYCANGFYSHNTKIRGFRANVVIADEFACLDKDTLIETENGLERISDITDIKTRVINKYGELESIERFVKTPKTDVYEIVTKYGYRFKCSNKHKVLTADGWKLGKDLNSNDFLTMRNSYIFPDNAYDNFITKNMAWLMGQLVSEGNVTSQYSVSIRTTNVKIVNKILNDFAYLNPKVYTRKAYVDNRGWVCKKSYEIHIHNKKFRDKLLELGISYIKADKKCIPSSILKSPKNIVVSFLSGLFEGDGSCFAWKDGDKTRLGIAYYTVSDSLAQDVQTLLLKLDIVIARRTRIGKLSERKQWILRANGQYALRLAKLLDVPKWKPIISKTVTHMRPATYGITFDKNRAKWKVAILSCGKTNNLGRYEKKSDALRVSRKFIDDHDDHLQVQSVTKLDYQDNLYDFHLPLTHSFYGNGFIQHNSIPEDVFDIVVRGFAATAKTPVEEAKRIAFDRTLSQIDLPPDIKKELTNSDGKMHGNQIIYSGTAYYAFNHFAKKYKMWLNIIQSKGDPAKVSQIFGGDNLIPDGFNYKDYSIIRLPHTHLPAGLLDDRQLAHAKATLPHNIYLMEYAACFVSDSDGFYPRSLIEGCTVGPNKPILTPDGDVTFTPAMRGIDGPKYVVGIDPAAERDNLAIVIVEVWANHCRVVYCWTVNKKEFTKRKKRGLITDDDYYAYCCSRIRDIIGLFNPIRIEMDSQGGGYAVAEMLRNKKMLDMDNGDFPIYEIIDFNDPKSTDGETDGRHILHLVKQSSDFNQEANICLHKSLETRTLLFPAFDSVKMYAAIEAEKAMGILFDTYEENVFNIEELKNELCTIQMSETSTGKERFDTPQVVKAGGVEGRIRRGRLRKDRYTALMLSHKYIYETSITPDETIDYEDVAGNIEKRSEHIEDEPLYRGPGIGRMRNGEQSRHGGIYKAIKRGKNI